MQNFMPTWRQVAIVVGVLLAVGLVWVVLLGPAALVLVTPRT
jgi:hypothetical protein